MPEFTQTTRHGHPLDEAASALQKSIRRSDHETAIYFARELLDHTPHYLWRRLKVICSEDIGLADPHMPATIAALHQSFDEARKQRGSDGFMFAAHAALLLALSRKSRRVDDEMLVVADVYREMPEWALDRHTKRGRQMGKGWTEFWSEGAMLVDPETGEINAEAIPNPYAEGARQAPGFCDRLPGRVAEEVRQLQQEQMTLGGDSV